MITLEEVRARFARDLGLPFADSLTESRILDALNEHGVTFRDRLFNPVTTIWGFLSQVLSDDHSCRDAVAHPRPPRRVRAQALLAEHRQLRRGPLALAHRRPAHPGPAHRPA